MASDSTKTKRNTNRLVESEWGREGGVDGESSVETYP